MASITALSAVEQVAEHLREALLRGANQVHVFQSQREEDVGVVQGVFLDPE